MWRCIVSNDVHCVHVKYWNDNLIILFMYIYYYLITWCIAYCYPLGELTEFYKNCHRNPISLDCLDWAWEVHGIAEAQQRCDGGVVVGSQSNSHALLVYTIYPNPELGSSHLRDSQPWWGHADRKGRLRVIWFWGFRLSAPIKDISW